MNPAETLTNSIDRRITSPTLQTPLFSVQDHAAAKYIRNPKCWAATIDLSCASPWNQEFGVLRAGTIISPLHFIQARHFATSVTVNHRYVSMANEVYEAKVVAQEDVHGADVYPGFGPDLVVGRYEKPLPPQIKPAAVLPSNWRENIPNAGFGLPCIALDQEEKALIQNVVTLDGMIVSTMPPQSGTRVMYYEDKVGGDSSNPIFLVWNDTPILIADLLFGGAGAGPSYSYYHDAINATMRSLGGGFQLTELAELRRPPVRGGRPATRGAVA